MTTTWPRDAERQPAGHNGNERRRSAKNHKTTAGSIPHLKGQVMEWIILLVLFGVAAAILLPMMMAGGFMLFAPKNTPTKQQRQERLANANQILAETFDGKLNASFVRDLGEPITRDMLMDAANKHGYALVNKDNAAGRITYSFVKQA